MLLCDGTQKRQQAFGAAHRTSWRAYETIWSMTPAPAALLSARAAGTPAAAAAHGTHACNMPFDSKDTDLCIMSHDRAAPRLRGATLRSLRTRCGRCAAGKTCTACFMCGVLRELIT